MSFYAIYSLFSQKTYVFWEPFIDGKLGHINLTLILDNKKDTSCGALNDMMAMS